MAIKISTVRARLEATKQGLSLQPHNPTLADAINAIERRLPRYEEYTTSLLTYTVLSEDQGYHDDDKQTVGSEYYRIQSHKAGLEGMSMLLKQQSLNSSSVLLPQVKQRSRLEWSGNMANLGAKIGGLRKELEWTVKVFREGHKQDEP
ncbi:MAG: hypothetical protein Q9198_004060 [Flavoplaca austrocitrina]